MPCIFTSDELQNFNSFILVHLDLRTANRISRAIVITLVVYSLCYLIQLSLPSGETNAQDVEPPQSMSTVEKVNHSFADTLMYSRLIDILSEQHCRWYRQEFSSDEESSSL